VSKKLFVLPEHCKTLNLCGRDGFPDRCATCGYDATKESNEAVDFDMEVHKQRVEELFERINRVINNES
jgi:hypothetical protein